MDADQIALAFAMGTHPRLGSAYVEMPADVAQHIVDAVLEAYRLEDAQLLVAKIDLEASTGEFVPYGMQGLELLHAWYDADVDFYAAMEKHDKAKHNSAVYAIRTQKLLAKRSSSVGWRTLKSRKRQDKKKIKLLADNYVAKKQVYYKKLHEVEAFKKHVYEAFSLVHREVCTSECVVGGYSYELEYQPHISIVCTHSLAAQQMHEAEFDIANIKKCFARSCIKIR